MNTKILRLTGYFFALAIATTALCLDLPALSTRSLAQNANSATTAPANTTVTTPRHRRVRKHKKAMAPAEDTSAMPAQTPDTTMTAPMTQTSDAGVATDLSGTYTGTMDCTDAGITGDTTLTITGNTFTTSDGKSGRIVTDTTRGYTAVAMQFGEFAPAANGQPGNTPTVVSMRAKRSGDRLTLLSVPGSGRVCSFTPAGSATRTRRRRARAAMPAAPATPETMTAPATPAEPATPPAEVGPVPSTTPTPRRGRRGRRGTTNTNMNSNMNSNSSMNDNTGEGNANARPTPTPSIRH